MAKIIYGERIGKLGVISVGCSATNFNPSRRKVLLTRRADNDLWCLPGGAMDPGESVTEACAREVWEGTGLQVRVGKLIGVYSDPHQLVEYADSNRFQIVALNFKAEPIGGSLRITEETTDAVYFSLAEIDAIDLMEHHRERIVDAFMGQVTMFVS